MTVSALGAHAASPTQPVRELVGTYRPLRDASSRIIRTSTRMLNTPSLAATALTPLIVDQVVEVFDVGCVSTRLRWLAWHLVSRGTRSSTPISMPDVFLPACLTPGTTGLIVIHNHPSGDPTRSPDDMALTRRPQLAGDVPDLPLLDHLISGEDERYDSFREAGALTALPPWR
jgi:DNA repair protein RadC